MTMRLILALSLALVPVAASAAPAAQKTAGDQRGVAVAHRQQERQQAQHRRRLHQQRERVPAEEVRDEVGRCGRETETQGSRATGLHR